MEIKVTIRGGHALIENQDASFSMTTQVSVPLLARMNGRRVAYFDATVERGGGKDKDGAEYKNPDEIIELGESRLDRSW